MQDLDETYVIEGELGRGGAARVWAARERVSGRAVAIKEPLSDEPAGFPALAREARLVASLAHPGIVRVLDAGTWVDGTPYLVMPRLRGRTLFEAMAAARTSRARRALIPVLVAVCDAMAYAHARGVVHRDLTPANIVIGDDGRVTVIDWGLAIEGGGGAPAGEMVGTLAYMAPEQLRGDAVDARADVHALGVILGELVGDDVRAPRALRLLAMRAAAFEARARPRDAAALGRALRQGNASPGAWRTHRGNPRRRALVTGEHEASLGRCDRAHTGAGDRGAGNRDQTAASADRTVRHRRRVLVGRRLHRARRGCAGRSVPHRTEALAVG